MCLFYYFEVQNIHHLQVCRKKRNYTNMSCMTLGRERKDLEESTWMTT